MPTHEENLKFCRDYHAAHGRGPIDDRISPKDCRCYRLDLEKEIALKARCEVGMPVYRVYGHGIEEGKIIWIGRGTYNSNGDLIRTDATLGTHDHYRAQFRYETESQNYEWKFFLDRKKAQERLVRELAHDISGHEREIAKLKKLIEENS